MSPGLSTEAFHVTRPEGDASPVVFDSPHSGIEWPEDFAPAAPQEALRTTWDAYVDELFAGAPDAGALLLAARFPRCYVDANRAMSDLDESLLATSWPHPIEPTDYSRRGMGLIRRLALPGVPIYARPLTVAEVQQRLERYYRPYRDCLREALDVAWQRHGFVWHVNCHSMKSRGTSMNTDAGQPRPDFVVSDRFGCTAAPALSHWVAAYLAKRGFDVRINDPYRGGDLIASMGNPAARRHSIQIEVNRRLYLDEATYERSAGFARLQRELADLARALVAHARERNGTP